MKTSAIPSADIKKAVVTHKINELNGTRIGRHSRLIFIKPSTQADSQSYVMTGEMVHKSDVDTTSSVKLSSYDTHQPMQVGFKQLAYHGALLSQKALPICFFLSGILLTFSWFHA